MGYELLENKILEVTHKLTNAMPTADLSAAPPAETGQVILDVPHDGRSVKTTELDQNISDDLAYQSQPVDISIDGPSHALTAGTSLQAEIHSTPISLGNFKTDSIGNLVAHTTIPSATQEGYHTLHFYGVDLNGQTIDIYKYIYVAKTTDDLDGNGIVDSTQNCIGVDSSNQDFDKDGVDDACDANITQPPVITQTQVPETSQSSNPSDQLTDSLGQNLFSVQAQPNVQSAIAINLSNEVNQILHPGPRSNSLDDIKPSVLGTITNQTKNPTPKNADFTNNQTKYFLPGLIIMAAGFTGLVFKRWVV
jgi:hypothetical protein